MRSCLAIVVVLILTLVLMITGQQTAQPDERGSQQTKEDVLLEAARDAHEAYVKEFQIGSVRDPEPAYRWSQRIMEIENRIADAESERTAAARAHIERVERLEEMVKIGHVGQYAVAATAFYHLEAKTLLPQAGK